MLIAFAGNRLRLGWSGTGEVVLPICDRIDTTDDPMCVESRLVLAGRATV
jgi:hypothetical protein